MTSVTITVHVCFFFFISVLSLIYLDQQLLSCLLFILWNKSGAVFNLKTTECSPRGQQKRKMPTIANRSVIKISKHPRWSKTKQMERKTAPSSFVRLDPSYQQQSAVKCFVWKKKRNLPLLPKLWFVRLQKGLRAFWKRLVLICLISYKDNVLNGRKVGFYKTIKKKTFIKRTE